MLQRFLQVDNYIQDPTNTQNYNQYGYVLNNPLKYTDPSGNAFNDGKDCANCGPTEVQQTAIGNGIKTIKDNWDDWGIKDWAKKNLNFNSWGRTWNKLWGKDRDRTPSHPPNMSSYASVNNASFTGGQMSMNNFNSSLTHDVYRITPTYSLDLKNVDKGVILGKTTSIGESIEIITAGLEVAGKATPFIKGLDARAGYIANFAEFADNSIKAYEGEVNGGISPQLYGYRTVGTATSFGVGTAITTWGVGGAYAGPFGVLAGVIIGAGFQGLEYSYNIIAPQIQGSFNHFFNALNSGNFVR